MSPGILVTRKLSVTFLPCSAINNSSLRSRLRHVPKSVASDTESERERNKSSRRNAARRWEIKEMAEDRDIGEKGMQDHRGCWKEDESKRIEIGATEKKITEKVVEQAESRNKLKIMDRKEMSLSRVILYHLIKKK